MKRGRSDDNQTAAGRSKRPCGGATEAPRAAVGVNERWLVSQVREARRHGRLPLYQDVVLADHKNNTGVVLLSKGVVWSKLIGSTALRSDTACLVGESK